MDIIDVLVAKTLTPQGQIESYAALAQKAVTDATAAVDNIDSITEQTNANNTAAEEALAAANEALAALEDGLDDQIDEEINKLNLTLSINKSGNSVLNTLITNYPDGTTANVGTVAKYYTGTGSNEDGSMTQKAITDLLRSIPSGGGSGGGSANLGPLNKDNVVIVGDTGAIISSTVSINDIINALMRMDSYDIPGTVGLEIDYINRSSARTQDAINYSAGTDFDNYAMYGGRKRCNVADNGAITAFYGDANYTEDGSNGQVMVYQPKFYYNRVPKALDNGVYGQIIRKEVITISPIPQAGFKLHPLFKQNGQEVDYVLLPAYDGCVYDTSETNYMLYDNNGIDFNADKLSSIAGAKPLSGANNTLNIENAEKLATNRGDGWHIMNMAAESAQQLLQLVEFGTLNGQSALELGIVNISDSNNYNCGSITGSTSTLGNTTGAATSTTNDINGNRVNYTDIGKRAISYRGTENPWGNMWDFIGGIIINGNATQAGGVPYICSDFNYSNNIAADNYDDIGFYLIPSTGYISAFGYGKPEYDWIFLPAEANGNNTIPVGDEVWVTSNLNGSHLLMHGGSWRAKEAGGPFSYGCDQEYTKVSRQLGAKLMYIPTINNIYYTNIQKWEQAN